MQFGWKFRSIRAKYFLLVVSTRRITLPILQSLTLNSYYQTHPKLSSHKHSLDRRVCVNLLMGFTLFPVQFSELRRITIFIYHWRIYIFLLSTGYIASIAIFSQTFHIGKHSQVYWVSNAQGSYTMAVFVSVVFFFHSLYTFSWAYKHINNYLSTMFSTFKFQMKILSRQQYLCSLI